jgi:hypothetical protein
MDRFLPNVMAATIEMLQTGRNQIGGKLPGISKTFYPIIF